MALNIDLELEGAEGYGRSLLLLSKSYKETNKKVYFTNWLVSLGINQTQFKDEFSGDEVKNEGYDLSLGLGVGLGESFDLDVLGHIEKSQDMDFMQSGAEVNFSFSNVDVKHPFMISMGYGQFQISQHVEFYILDNLIERDFDFDQELYQAYGMIIVSSWLTIKYKVQFFDYSVSKSKLQKTYPSQFFNNYAPDLISNIGRLPEKTNNLQMIIDLKENWEISCLGDWTHLIVDDSNLTRTEIFALRDFKNWHIGGGLSQTKSSMGKSHSVLFKWGFIL